MILLNYKLFMWSEPYMNKTFDINFDDEVFDQIDESCRDINLEEDDQVYFPIEYSKPPHY